jgi:coenzyme F420-reducing hydrogenase alpha subunit
MPKALNASVSGRPNIRLSHVDGNWTAQFEYEFPKNPYRLALGLPLADVVPVVARQYGAYPNPHLLAAIRACEAVADVRVPAVVTKQRIFTAQAICIRDIALHLAICCQVGMMGETSERIVPDVLALAKAGREIERALAGNVSSPKLFFGGSVAPDRERLQCAVAQLKNQTANCDIKAVLVEEKIEERDYGSLLLSAATRLGRLSHRLTSDMPNCSYADYDEPIVSSTMYSEAIVVIQAPRGDLVHAVHRDSRTSTLLNGTVSVPTEQIMVRLEKQCAEIVGRETANGVGRERLEERLIMLARAHNPCGLDLSGNFIDIVWAD